MRILRNILLIVGCILLGGVACGLGLPYLAAITIYRPRRGEDPSLQWGAATALLGLIACGGVLGAILGGSTAFRWVARNGQAPFNPVTWVGAGLGLLTGFAVAASGFSSGLAGELFPPFDMTAHWAMSAAILSVCGVMLGGMTAAPGHRVVSPATRGRMQRKRNMGRI